MKYFSAGLVAVGMVGMSNATPRLYHRQVDPHTCACSPPVPETAGACTRTSTYTTTVIQTAIYSSGTLISPTQSTSGGSPPVYGGGLPPVSTPSTPVPATTPKVGPTGPAPNISPPVNSAPPINNAPGYSPPVPPVNSAPINTAPPGYRPPLPPVNTAPVNSFPGHAPPVPPAVNTPPVNSAPINTAPVHRPIPFPPVNSAPVNSALGYGPPTPPVNSAPINTAPVNSAPVPVPPVNSAPVNSAPGLTPPINTPPGPRPPVNSAPYYPVLGNFSTPAATAPIVTAPGAGVPFPVPGSSSQALPTAPVPPAYGGSSGVSPIVPVGTTPGGVPFPVSSPNGASPPFPTGGVTVTGITTVYTTICPASSVITSGGNTMTTTYGYSAPSVVTTTIMSTIPLSPPAATVPGGTGVGGTGITPQGTAPGQANRTMYKRMDADYIIQARPSHSAPAHRVAQYLFSHQLMLAPQELHQSARRQVSSSKSYEGTSRLNMRVGTGVPFGTGPRSVPIPLGTAPGELDRVLCVRL